MEDTTPRNDWVPAAEPDTAHANRAPDRAAVVGVGGEGIVRLDLAGGSGQWITLIQAFSDSAPKAYLQRFGTGPYAVNLRKALDADVHPGDGRLIDPDLMSGARIYL